MKFHLHLPEGDDDLEIRVAGEDDQESNTPMQVTKIFKFILRWLLMPVRWLLQFRTMRWLAFFIILMYCMAYMINHNLQAMNGG